MRTRLASIWIGLLMAALSARAEVTINEIMYRPASNLAEDDFVELYNPDPTVVLLGGWCVNGLEFCFPPTATIAPGGYRVLAANQVQFLATYGFAPDFEYLGSIDNSGETLSLIDGFLVVRDSVDFTDLPPWPVTPDGLGPSLELIDPAQDNDTPRNWRASEAVAGHTAGQLNSVDAEGLPPWIQNVAHSEDALPGAPIVITAEVLDATVVQLNYVIDFDTETTVTLHDDGASLDGAAGDGVYGASIPGQPAGTLVRYRLTASGSTGVMKLPRADDTVTYTGTIVPDPDLESTLPVMHWFMDPADYQAALDHVLTDDTEPAVLFYGGTVYDNVRVRVRGGTSRTWPKKHWKFSFPTGHDFFAVDLIEEPINSVNLQSGYSDKSWSRELLSYATAREAGSAWNQAFHVRLHQNGEFFGLYLYVEDSDESWIIRNRLRGGAARYKADDDLRNRGSAAALESHYDKLSRTGEDYSDLFQLVLGIDTLSGETLRDFLFDNLDIPAMVNYLAVQALVHNTDHLNKNYYLYRDTNRSGRWTLHIRDMDLTFGRNDVDEPLNDLIWADVDTTGNADEAPSHPLLGDSGHRNASSEWNRLIDAIYAQPEIRTMYLRRLRTLADKLLATSFYPNQLAEIEPLIATEAALDVSTWGQYGVPQSLGEAIDILETDYLAIRQTHLLTTHRVPGEVPGPQSATPPIVITELMYWPELLPDQEYVELYNPSRTESIDLSGWRLDGVGSKLPEGTVILPLTYLVVVPSDSEFRLQYGGGYFVAGEYDGRLSNTGERVALVDLQGNEITAVGYFASTPWPMSPAGSGPSLELIDIKGDNGWIGNWAASLATGGTPGTPGAPNSVAATGRTAPGLFINEVLPVNVSVNSDEIGEFDPWIELYNASETTVDLGGMHLTDDHQDPTRWTIPANTPICAGCWLVIWADGEVAEGPLHTSFALNPAGGTVGLYDSGGLIVDFLDYGALAANTSFGRFPDAAFDRRAFTRVTPDEANDATLVPLVLNEYNAVADDRLLDNAGEDVFWGRIAGNGGDWFELVVTVDRLDVRGWRLDVSDGVVSTSLAFSDDPLWADLPSGTIITVSEILPDDTGLDPSSGDWWINVRAAAGASGAYITAQDFFVSNQNWQLTIRDSEDRVVFGPAGEGINPLSGVGGDEVLKLEESPSPVLTPLAAYNDGTSSTFGSPNVFFGGTLQQDFDTLRCGGIDCSALDEACTIGICNGFIGECESRSAGEGMTCDDGNACTQSDSCVAGSCTGVAPAAPTGGSLLTVDRLAGVSHWNWTPVVDASGYDVVSGTLALLRGSDGDFSSATESCLTNDVADTTLTDPVPPAAGEGIWYLVRAVNCGGAGSYDSGGAEQHAPRDGEIALAAGRCP